MDELFSLPGGQIVSFIALLILLTLIFDVALLIIFKVIRFMVKKTKTTLDDRIVKTIKAYLPIIAFVTALWISLETVYADMIVFGQYSEFDLYVVIMLALGAIILSSVIDVLIIWYGIEIRPTKKGIKEKEVYPFVRAVIKLTIILLFLVFILQKLGFDTTALITGLGIGGLAVALALQDTLANFFAGIHIYMDRPFKQDDYVKLETGIEGTVREIGWRTTRLMTPTKNEIVVPNSKMAGSILENYSSTPELGVSYTLGVSHHEDVNKVEKLIEKALHKVAKQSEFFVEDKIWVRFDSFGEYALNFKFGYQVIGEKNRWQILKEVNKEIFYQFKKNKISMPLPARVVYQK